MKQKQRAWCWWLIPETRPEVFGGGSGGIRKQARAELPSPTHPTTSFTPTKQRAESEADPTQRPAAMRGTGRELPALGLTAPSRLRGHLPALRHPAHPRLPLTGQLRGRTDGHRDRETDRQRDRGPSSRRAAPPPPAFSHHSDRRRGRGPRSPPTPGAFGTRRSRIPRPKPRISLLEAFPRPLTCSPGGGGAGLGGHHVPQLGGRDADPLQALRHLPSRPARRGDGAGGEGEGRRPGGDKKGSRERGTEPLRVY